MMNQLEKLIRYGTDEQKRSAAMECDRRAKIAREMMSIASHCQTIEDLMRLLHEMEERNLNDAKLLWLK
jgi:hypothetical protein